MTRAFLAALLLVLGIGPSFAQMPPPGPIVTNPSGNEFLGIVGQTPGTSIQLDTVKTFVGAASSFEPGTTPIVGASSPCVLVNTTGTTSGCIDLTNSYLASGSFANITGVGTLTAGTWSATAIGANVGGTGIDNSSSTGVAQWSSGSYSASTALANGTTATTQSTGDTSAKLATDAFISNTLASPPAIGSVAPAAASFTNVNASGQYQVGGVQIGYGNGLTGFGTMATQNANNVDITGATAITGLPMPVGASDAATKQYVDNSATGLTVHTPSVAATTADLGSVTYNNGSSGVGATLTNAGTQAAFSVDGVSPSVNARVLVKDESTAAYNGIYTLTTVGSGSTNWVLTRATDANTPGTQDPTKIGSGTYTLVTSGSTQTGSSWVVNSTVTTIGTSAINWTQFSAANNAVACGSTDQIQFNSSGTFGCNSTFVYSGGNVGIGTTAPTFDPVGTTFLAVNSSTAHSYSEVGIGGNATTSGDAAGCLSFFNSSLVAAEKRISAVCGITSGTTNSGSLSFYTTTSGALLGPIMTLLPNGNVGIGTTSPNFGHLEVADTNNGSQIFVTSNNNNSGLVLNNTGAGGISWFVYSTDNSSIAGGGALRLANTISSSDALVINSSNAIALNGSYGAAGQCPTTSGSSSAAVWDTCNIGYVNINKFGSLACNTGAPTSSGVAAAAVAAYVAGNRHFFIPAGCFINTNDSSWVSAFGAMTIPTGTYWRGGDQNTAGISVCSSYSSCVPSSSQNLAGTGPIVYQNMFTMDYSCYNVDSGAFGHPAECPGQFLSINAGTFTASWPYPGQGPLLNIAQVPTGSWNGTDQPGIGINNVTEGDVIFAQSLWGSSGTNTANLLNLFGNGAQVGYWVGNGKAGFGNTSTSHSGAGIIRIIDNTGQCDLYVGTSQPAWACSSDQRLKKNITNADDQLKWLGSFDIRQFDLKSNNQHITAGVIAQEVAANHPEMVRVPTPSHPNDPPPQTCGPGHYASCYTVDGPNVWQMMKAMQEMQAEIVQLQQHH